MDRRDEFNDELLSAYLDGEVTDEERAAVLSHLAHDPAAQELVDELKAAAQSVRELPHLAAPRGLKESIVHAAAERMQPGGVSPDGSDGEASPAAAVSAPSWTIGRSRRGWMWGALAVAAALLIMVLSGENGRERDLAREAGDAEGRDRTRESVEPPDRMEESAPPRGERRNVEPPSDNGRGLGRAAEPSAESRGPQEPTDRLLQEQVADFVPSVAAAGEVPDATLSREPLLRSDDADVDYAENETLASSQPFYVKLPADESGSGGVPLVVENASAAFFDGSTGAAADTPVYFVSVNITPEAVRNKAVSRLFGRNSISFVDAQQLAKLEDLQQPALQLETARESSAVETDAAATLGDARASGLEASGEASAPAGRGAANRFADAEVDRFEKQLSLQPAPNEGAATSTPVSEVVAVEAPAEQAAALLAALSADQEHVRALAVVAQQSEAAKDEALASPTEFNRNAEQALSQVAGTWRFAPAVQTTEALALNGNLAVGGFAGGYGGGYGSGIRARRYGGGADFDSTAAATADAYGIAPEPRRGGYQAPEEASTDAVRLRDSNAPAQQAPPAPSPGEAQQWAQPGGAEQLAELYERKESNGQAWVVSPLPVRSPAREEAAQSQQRLTEGGGAPLAEAEVRAPPEGESQFADTTQPAADAPANFGAKAAEPAAPSRRREASGERSATSLEFRSAAPPPLAGQQPAADPQQAAGFAPPQPPPPRPAEGAMAGAVGRQQQGQAGEEVTQLDAKAASKQVRLLLFFNVVPPSPVAAAAAAPFTTAPAEAVEPNER